MILNTGETETLYEEASIIIDVLIHPSKNYLLLHTSDNPTSATVKIISIDGIIQDEIEVASTELAIEWNDLNPPRSPDGISIKTGPLMFFFITAKIDTLDFLRSKIRFQNGLVKIGLL